MPCAAADTLFPRGGNSAKKRLGVHTKGGDKCDKKHAKNLCVLLIVFAKQLAKIVFCTKIVLQTAASVNAKAAVRNSVTAP